MHRNKEKQILDFLHGLYAPRGGQQLIEFILQGIPGIVDGHNRCVSRYDPVRRAILQMNLHTPFVSRAFLDALREGGDFVSESLWELLPQARDTFHIISHQFSRAQWDNHSMYREMLLSEGIIDGMTMELGDANRRYMICVHRDRRGFTAEEIDTFRLLSPHLVQAFSNACIYEAAIPGLAAASSGNSKIHHLGTRGDTASGKFIRENLDRWKIILGHEIATADLRAWIDHGFNHLACGILESALSPFSLQGPNATIRFTLMRNWGGDGHLITEETTARWHLTPRETEVLHWVRDGKTDRDIATILNLSHHTVKEHLRRIYQKTGTRTRTAAARLAPSGNPTPASEKWLANRF